MRRGEEGKSGGEGARGQVDQVVSRFTFCSCLCVRVVLWGVRWLVEVCVCVRGVEVAGVSLWHWAPPAHRDHLDLWGQLHVSLSRIVQMLRNQSAFTFRGFCRHFYPKQLTTIHTHNHSPTAESTMQGDGQPFGSSQVRCLAPRQLGGAGDRDSKLPFTKRPALPPEQSALG